MELEDETDPAIAAAMGFSGFGTQPNALKRKHRASNDNTGDAAETSTVQRKKGISELTTIQREDDKSDPTGSAIEPVRDEGAAEGGVPPAQHPPHADIITSSTHYEQNTNPSNPAPASTPPSAANLIHTTSSLPQPPAPGTTHSLPARPTEPPPGLTSTTQHAPSRSGSDLNAFRRGFKDANGDVAYFLPSFIEDPWRRLRASVEG